jgi:hypothetical protein
MSETRTVPASPSAPSRAAPGFTRPRAALGVRPRDVSAIARLELRYLERLLGRRSAPDDAPLLPGIDLSAPRSDDVG